MTDLGNCSQLGDPSLERGFILWSDISLIRQARDGFAALLVFRPRSSRACHKPQRCSRIQ